MTRKRFIKIMQSKGLQRNDATRLAKKIGKTRGLSFKFMSQGTVTDYGKDFFILKFSNYEAFICSRSQKPISRVAAYRSPPAISASKYLLAAPNISFNFFGDGKPIDEKGFLLKQKICDGGNK